MSPQVESEANGFAEDVLKAPDVAAPRKYEIYYFNVLTLTYWHVAGLYGLYLCFTTAKLQTVIFSYVTFVIAQVGASAGAHRLWSHRSYKAKMPLQIILMLMTCITFQNTVIDWVRNHRLHHKYSDTDADPHNASRGFFYSHYGWIVVRKHPEIMKRGRLCDFSDIYGNPVLVFQKKYAIPLFGLFCFILPTVIPMYFWSETLMNAWHINILRYAVNLNVTFLINSVAHMWGPRPYEKTMLPVQNRFLNFLTFGEGYHNFHHTFPWDYRSAEIGNTKCNVTTMFIDFFAWIGWAYDMKTVPESVVKKRMERTGDGTDFYGNKKHPSQENVVDSYDTTKS